MGPNPGRGVSASVQKLHVIGYDPDRGGFILAARKGAKSGGYFLALDETLRREVDRAGAADRETSREAPGTAVRPGASSLLTPREIQARLRSGASLEEVAEEAAVGVGWVERFAGPVLAERIAAVQRAGQTVLQTPRKGPSDRPLDGSVRRNLADRGVAISEEEYRDAWSARHLLDTDWLVAFEFRSRGRAMTAEWVLDLANGALTPRNRLGADLGFTEAGRPAPAGGTAEGDGAGKSTELPEPARRAAAAPKETGRRRVSVPVAAPAAPAPGRATRRAEPAESPRLPLDDFGDTPDAGGARSGNPD